MMGEHIFYLCAPLPPPSPTVGRRRRFDDHPVCSSCVPSVHKSSASRNCFFSAQAEGHSKLQLQPSEPVIEVVQGRLG